jgi:hypothetical protein
MYENVSDLLKQIAVGLELKAVEFSGNKVIGPPAQGRTGGYARLVFRSAGNIFPWFDPKHHDH